MSSAELELAALRCTRLKGRISLGGLSEATGVAEAAVAVVVEALVDRGLLRRLDDQVRSTPAGAERLAHLLACERQSVDPDAAEDLLRRFDVVNGPFKRMASDWQVRDGEPNDHGDHAYDAEVLQRLPQIHADVEPIVADAARLVSRLAPFEQRFERALDRVGRGELDWLLKPLLDSYHTVWFELHEELIGLAGKTRADEAVSGRAV